MILPQIFAALSAIGAMQLLAGTALSDRFARRIGPVPSPTEPVTILKPLHGAEPLLIEALTTLCQQDYPPGFQIVCGVGRADDAAVPAVRAVQARFPGADIVLVVDSAVHGTNPKVGNLINMYPHARHDLIVIADSDVHARPDYLRRLAAALSRPGVGLATCLYAGLPAGDAHANRLGATQITHGFLPGALLARALGRRDCLGATMALRRETLERIGGLRALKDHLADDNVLGQRVRASGLDVALAETVVATTVPEQTLSALWKHEMRWARTIRTLEPLGFAASVLQYPLYWAAMTVASASAEVWSLALFAVIWAIRAAAAVVTGRALAPLLEGLAFRCPLWLLPVRDMLSAAEWAAAHTGRRVDWRGLTLRADTPPRLIVKGSNAR